MSYYGYEDEREYYELSLVNEIVAEYQEKMKTALLNSVKQDILSLKESNAALINENKILKDERSKVIALEQSVKYEKDNLMRTVRRERLSEIMKDFQIVLYKVKDIRKALPKCDKCNSKRQMVFNSPSGKELGESCVCAATEKHYIPQEYICSEFNFDRDKTKMIAWYKIKQSDYDKEDYYSLNSDFAEIVYSDEMKYEDLKTWSTYFKSEEDCQKYCDWLNNEVQP